MFVNFGIGAGTAVGQGAINVAIAPEIRMDGALVSGNLNAGVRCEERAGDAVLIEQRADVGDGFGRRPLDVEGKADRSGIEFGRPAARPRALLQAGTKTPADLRNRSCIDAIGSDSAAPRPGVSASTSM
jgi:hypothetical protein